FYLMHDVYERSFRDFFGEIGHGYDTAEAVNILFREHALSHFYTETAGFLERVSREYQVCIVSDADDAMIFGFYEQYGVRLFTSERHQSYKNDHKNTMFKELLQFYGVQPGQVIHIGDSASDVLGADREGIITCWINRDNRTWQHEVKPDYIIESLDQLDDILPVAVKYGLVEASPLSNQQDVHG
ncbi:MAG: hypothetical protein K0R57_3691, partial [Paenibacillaceae bacterium]|nr:hypothetical protein [Paenibacillaceae bacterium]